MRCSNFDYCSDCIKKASRNHPRHRFETLHEPESRKRANANRRAKDDERGPEGSKGHRRHRTPAGFRDDPRNRKAPPVIPGPQPLHLPSRLGPAGRGHGGEQKRRRDEGAKRESKRDKRRADDGEHKKERKVSVPLKEVEDRYKIERPDDDEHKKERRVSVPLKEVEDRYKLSRPE